MSLSDSAVRSPSGSPRSISRSTTETAASAAKRTKRKSTTTTTTTARSSPRKAQASSHQAAVAAVAAAVSSTPEWVDVSLDPAESKFRRLWESSAVEQGMVRLPDGTLEGIINTDDIENIFELEEKPVAR